MKVDKKNEIVHNKCYTPKLKKANKIRLELFSLIKDQIDKKESKFNKHFSISKKEKKIDIEEKETQKEKKDNNEKINVEQDSNVIINSNNSDTEDSGLDSSDMSGCEEEII